MKPSGAPCNGIQDSLGFHDSRYWMSYPSPSVELGFPIPIVIGILDSINSIPDSKPQDSGFRIPQAKISRIPFTWGEKQYAFAL